MSNALALVLAATLAAPAADTVHLKSGGFVRGVVEEYEPGGTVVLRKSDGSVRTFTADEVDRVELGDAAEPAETPPRSKPPVAEAPASDPTAARVHIVRGDRRSDRLALQRRTGGVFVSGYGGSASGFSWENVCTAPCDRSVDTNGIFFVNGINKGPALASKPVNLDPYKGKDVTLEVRGGSLGAFIGGVTLMTVGGTLAGVSSIWFIDDERNKAVGGTMLAAGLGGFVGGIIMLLRSRHRVKARQGRPG